MLSITIFLLISVVNAQYYYPQQQQQQYPSNNYNSWSSYSQNNPSWNQVIQQNRASIRGNLLNDDLSVLPYGSRITITIADTSLQDVAARPLSSVVLHGSYRFPIPYEISYPSTQMQANGNNLQQYSLQARIEKDGQLLYINDQYTPVRLIPTSVAPINILMKRVSTPIYSGINRGVYTTRSPALTGIYICQLIPEPGNCLARIQQYYFNTQLRSCQMFTWGGCGGNQNRFSSRDECEYTCSTYRRRILNKNAKQVPIA